MRYNENINCRAYTPTWLTNRANALRRAGQYGTLAERTSANRQAELAAIETALAAAPRPARSQPVLFKDQAAQLAAQPAFTVLPAGPRGYSEAMRAVSADFNPNKYDRY